MIELPNNHFCSGEGCPLQNDCIETCVHYHHKWPTAEQFEYEYGRKPDDMPTYQLIDVLLSPDKKCWVLMPPGEFFSLAVAFERLATVIACTPFGKPPASFNPTEEAQTKR